MNAIKIRNAVMWWRITGMWGSVVREGLSDQVVSKLALKNEKWCAVANRQSPEDF